MSFPAFIQQQPRSLGVPIVLALLLLAAAGLGYSRYMQQGKLEIKAATTPVIETKSVYKSDSNVLTPPHTEVVLFIAPVLAVANHRNIPITVNDFQLTVKDATGAQLTANPMSAAQIASAEQSFPQLKPVLTDSLLRREAELAPGGSLKGVLLFSLQIGRAQWDTFKSADLTVDIYNQPAIVVPLK